MCFEILKPAARRVSFLCICLAVAMPIPADAAHAVTLPVVVVDSALAELRAARGAGVADECAAALHASASDIDAFVGHDELLDVSMGVGFTSTYPVALRHESDGAVLRLNDGERTHERWITAGEEKDIRAALAAVVSGERRVVHEGIMDGSCQLFMSGGRARLLRTGEDAVIDHGADAMAFYERLLDQIVQSAPPHASGGP